MISLVLQIANRFINTLTQQNTILETALPFLGVAVNSRCTRFK